MTTTPLSIGILLGSARKAAFSTAVARAAIDFAPEGTKLSLLPHPVSLPHYDQDLLDEGLPDSVATLAEAVRGCDAVLIVTPEYNWSFPGTLKNAVDWLSRLKPNPLEDKPAAIWTVSPGLLGGARAHEGLRHVLHSQGARIFAKPEVQVGGAAAKVDVAAGQVTRAETKAFLQDHLKRFHDFSCK